MRLCRRLRKLNRDYQASTRLPLCLIYATSPSLQPGWVAAEFNVSYAAPSSTLRHALQRLTKYTRAGSALQ